VALEGAQKGGGGSFSVGNLQNPAVFCLFFKLTYPAFKSLFLIVKLLLIWAVDPELRLKSVIVLYRLWKCGVTDEGCAALASALRSNPSHLKELDLFDNKLGPSGMNLLFALKDDSHYKLEKLQWVVIIYYISE